MTNKTPIVGQKYASKRSGNIVDIKEVRTTTTIVTNEGDLWPLYYFNNEFKELTKDNKTASKENHICTLTKEVLEAMEESKKESIWKPVSELPKYHCQIFVKFKNHDQIFVYDCDGNSIINLDNDELDTDYVKEFCTLSDFINQHNSLLDRVERLEKIIGDKKYE